MSESVLLVMEIECVLLVMEIDEPSAAGAACLPSTTAATHSKARRREADPKAGGEALRS